MTMDVQNIIKKIPGDIPPLKKESQGYIEDLDKKSKFELQEILKRQEKILANRKFILRLPDKGEKIIKFRNKLIAEIGHKNEVDEAAAFFSRLNIAVEGKAAMTKLEWTGKYSEHPEVEKIVELDSDDEDPLHILAQPTGTGTHKKKIIHLPREETLIKPEDLEEIESINELDTKHIKHIVDTVEHSKDWSKNKKTGSFKPYRTTISNVHDLSKERARKKNKFWEVTAATPAPIIHDSVKTLDVMESLRLQKEQAEKLKKIQAKHAMERLANLVGNHKIGPLPSNVGPYRTNNSDTSSSEDEQEHEEVHDDDDDDRRGTVVFTVDSIES